MLHVHIFYVYIMPDHIRRMSLLEFWHSQGVPEPVLFR